VAANDIGRGCLATDLLEVLSRVVDHGHHVAALRENRDVIKKRMVSTKEFVLRHSKTFDLLGITLNVLLSKASFVTSGIKDLLVSIVLGPEMATAGIPVCAPVIIERPPPKLWPVMARPKYLSGTLF